MDSSLQDTSLLSPSEILELTYKQRESFSTSSCESYTSQTYMTSTIVPCEAMAPPSPNCHRVVSVKDEDINSVILFEEEDIKRIETLADLELTDCYAMYHMYKTVYSPEIESDYTCEEYVPTNSSIKVEEAPKICREYPVYPLRKDPRLIRVDRKSREWTGFGVNAESNVTIQKQLLARLKLFPVVLHFQKRKEFFAIIALSGLSKEYKLPIFASLTPFRILETCQEYQTTTEITDSHVEVLSNSDFSDVSIKRYESRLTIAQMAIILGLQDYKVSLTKYIETSIFMMLEQLCGFHIGDHTWSRGSVKKERNAMVLNVTRFMKAYFPMLTPDLVEIIIKRGCYSRTQKLLRRRRNRLKHKLSD